MESADTLITVRAIVTEAVANCSDISLLDLVCQLLSGEV